MPLPSVSVIIPCYNRALLVGETVENMLQQTLPPREVIVVDDGSTDNSVEVIKSFGERVRLIQQPNRGPGAARNAGLAAATGDFVQFMDSDDLASLNKLEVQAAALAASGAEMAYGPWTQVQIENRHVSRIEHILQPEPVPSQLPLHEWHLRGWALVLQNCLFTRSFLNRLTPLREDLLGTEDFEFLSRVFLSGPKVVFTANCLVFYRLHDAGKLSGGGTTKPQKLDHLARALSYISANLQQAARPLRFGTRFIFAYKTWQLWCEMSTCRKFQPAQLEQLRRISGGFSPIVFQVFNWWDRIGSALRARLTGNRWARPYGARRAGPQELHLMREAGLMFD